MLLWWALQRMALFDVSLIFVNNNQILPHFLFYLKKKIDKSAYSYFNRLTLFPCTDEKCLKDKIHKFQFFVITKNHSPKCWDAENNLLVIRKGYRNKFEIEFYLEFLRKEFHVRTEAVANVYRWNSSHYLYLKKSSSNLHSIDCWFNIQLLKFFMKFWFVEF